MVVEKTVKSFAEFKKKYGVGGLPKRHPLTTVKRSFYHRGVSKLKKKKRRMRGRVGIQNVRKFSDLPQAKAYRERVPAGFSRGAKGDYYVGGIGKGWRNVRADDHDRHVMAGMGMPSERKPRAHRAFSLHQTEHGILLTPRSNVVDSRFDIPATQEPSVVQEPQEVAPPVTTEFDLDKRRNPKFSISRGLSKTGTYADNVGKSYDQLRQEAIQRRSLIPPTAEEVGAGALARDVRTAKFASSKTVQLVRGGVGWLQARKKRKEAEKRDKLYAQAQERAETQRIQRIELQTELDKAKIDELKRRVPNKEVEENRKIAKDAMSFFEREPKVKQLNKEEAEKEYASV